MSDQSRLARLSSLDDSDLDFTIPDLPSLEDEHAESDSEKLDQLEEEDEDEDNNAIVFHYDQLSPEEQLFLCCAITDYMPP